MGKSRIEWTEATWNPIVGCSIATPGCINCYAMKMASRIEAINAALPDAHGPATHYAGTTHRVNGKPVWTGKLSLAPENVLLAPLRRKTPTIYFVNSMGDLFHEETPVEWIDKAFAIMALAPRHTFQVLTKRSARMREYFSDPVLPRRRWEILIEREKLTSHFFSPSPLLSNVWLGVSTERQQEADTRIPDLIATNAAKRFISAEPLLGPIDIAAYGAQLDWVIAGGESGGGARPMAPAWARLLREQCAAGGTPFFFKQWGSHAPKRPADFIPGSNLDSDEMMATTKKASGRKLDVVLHDAMPEISA